MVVGIGCLLLSVMGSGQNCAQTYTYGNLLTAVWSSQLPHPLLHAHEYAYAQLCTTAHINYTHIHIYTYMYMREGTHKPINSCIYTHMVYVCLYGTHIYILRKHWKHCRRVRLPMQYYIYIPIGVYMHRYACVCTNTWIHLNTLEHTCKGKHTRLQGFQRAYLSIYIYIYVHIFFMHTYITYKHLPCRPTYTIAWYI